MAFDIEEFLSQHGIDYADEGSKNVGQGHVGIPCPWCGDDPSQHLGIDKNTGAFHCWRNPAHSSKKPHKLIMRLLGCSYREATRIVGDQAPPLSKFDEIIGKLQEGASNTKVEHPRLYMPEEFKKLKPSGSGKRFTKYLENRGFQRKDVDSLAIYYGLRYCLTGRWKDRIIIPIYFQSNLVTWTARSIYPNAEMRYMTLTANPEKAKERGDPCSTMNIKETIYNYDKLKYGGRVLYICEGPFDALKVDFYGKPRDVRATCLYGLDIKDEQYWLLSEVAENFDEVYVMLDSASPDVALHMRSKLSREVDGIAYLPKGVKDPGDLTPTQIRDYV